MRRSVTGTLCLVFLSVARVACVRAKPPSYHALRRGTRCLCFFRRYRCSK